MGVQLVLASAQKVATVDGNVNMPFFAWEHQQNEVFEDFCEFSNMSNESCFADLQNLDFF